MARPWRRGRRSSPRTAGVVLAPQLLADTLELGRGAVLGPAGFRLWGIAEGDDMGELFLFGGLLRASPGGVLDGLHFMQNPMFFTYLEFHKTDFSLAVPFVGSDADQSLQFFLQELTLPGCGLPVTSNVQLGAGNQIVATGFTNASFVWVSRDASDCGGKVDFFHSFFETAASVAAPVTPGDGAAVVRIDDDQLVWFNPAQEAVEVIGMNVTDETVAAPLAIELPGHSVDVVRARVAPAGFSFAWLGSSGADTVIGAAAGCPAPTP